jgi:hypothetical protein
MTDQHELEGVGMNDGCGESVPSYVRMTGDARFVAAMRRAIRTGRERVREGAVKADPEDARVIRWIHPEAGVRTASSICEL